MREQVKSDKEQHKLQQKREVATREIRIPVPPGASQLWADRLRKGLDPAAPQQNTYAFLKAELDRLKATVQRLQEENRQYKASFNQWKTLASNALHKGKSCSAPGSDKVTMTTLKNLPENTELQLLNWTNLIYRVKQGDAQTGIRPRLGTQERLALISSSVFLNVHKSKFRTIVAIDMKKAFDSVPHSTITKDASRLNITGRTLNFFKSFLEGTTFSVRCSRHNSVPRANNLGVPQGSVLSPMLFNLAIVALPHELSKISGLEYTIYEGDVSIWAYGEDLEKQKDILQSCLDTIEAHLTRVEMLAAPDKTNNTVVRSPRIRVKEDYAAKLNLVLAGGNESSRPLR
ncbi:hypothetical protein ISCGN_001772 [Ixodes scapularis]